MSKRKKLSGVDRISDLPDSLLCHILSFLPTKEVVATSILSSRWTTLWTHVPYLDFEDTPNYFSSQYDHNDNRMRFTHFVSRVLTLLKAPTVEAFRLQCEGEIDPFHVNAWVCAAIGGGVKKLDLSPDGENIIQLPCSVFTCESLVVLKLGYKISLKCPAYIHLPCLKLLHLEFNVDYDEDSMYADKLFSGCPILEDLQVDLCLWRETTFNISIPTLKSLRFYINQAITFESKVQIITPFLDNLVIHDIQCSTDYLLNKLQNLVQADVNIFDYRENHGDCVLKLLRELYNVETLSFSYITRGINTSLDDFPLFQNLVDLKLGVDSFGCHVLKTLLENSPNLKVLDVDDKTYEERESCWSQPSCVPKCLLSHLETFYINSFKRSMLEVVEYILKNGKVLVTTTVYASTCYHHYRCLCNLEEKFDLLKKLSMLPRGSKTCQLEFH